MPSLSIIIKLRDPLVFELARRWSDVVSLVGRIKELSEEGRVALQEHRMDMEFEVVEDLEAEIWLETRCRGDDGAARMRRCWRAHDWSEALEWEEYCFRDSNFSFRKRLSRNLSRIVRQ